MNINKKNISICIIGIILIIILFLKNYFPTKKVEKRKINIDQHILKENSPQKRIKKFIDFESSNNSIQNRIDSKREQIINSKKKDFSFLLKTGSIESQKLFNAIFNNDYDYLLQLDKKGFKFKNITKNHEMILEMASYFLTDFRILDILIEQGLPVINTFKRNCFQTALEARNFAFLEYLINEKGYNINYDANKFSLKLQSLGHKDLEKWVEKFGGEYNIFDEKNIIYVINNLSDKTKIEKLINKGFIFSNTQIMELINRTSVIGDIEVLSYLKNISAGIDKSFTDSHGNNALLSSIYSHKDNLELTKWLLEEGYNPKQRNLFGEDALGLATRNKKEDVILYLLKNNYMEPYKNINVRGKLKNKETGTFDIKTYDNLYVASKKEELKKVSKYLEEYYGF